MADVLISVVVATRDRRSLLQEALRSVLDQSFAGGLEVIVVDDGSSDDTPAYLATLGDERVRAFRHDASRGVAAARNRAIREARGAWLAFLDDDDLWAPRKLARQLALAETTGAGLVCTHAIVVDEARVPRAREVLVDSEALPDELLRTNAVGTPSSVLVRRDLVVAAGGFDERLAVLADWDLWLAILPHARCVVCPEALIAYAEHADGMHARRLDDAVREFALLSRKHRVLVRSRGARRLGSARWWRWVAEAYDAQGRRRAAAAARARAVLWHGSRSDLMALLGLRGPRGPRAGVVDDAGWLERYRR